MKKIENTPVIMQMEALECGAACLAMVLAHYGKWIPLEQLREDCGVSRDGSLASNIVKAARRYALEAKGFRYEIDELRANARFPVILHWNFNHFVVLNGFRRNTAVINDPALGRVEIPMDEFEESFTGICLTFEPSKDFVKSGRPVSIGRFILNRLRGMALPVVLIAAACIAGGFFDLLNPLLSGVYIDRVLSGTNVGWLGGLLALLALAALIRLVIMGANAVYLVKAEGRTAILSGASFMWHILHLPMRFFSQRMAGDIAQRQISNDKISQALLQQLAPIAINFALLLFYLLVMARFSLPLTAIVLAGTSINICLADIITKKRLNITRVQMRDEGKLYSITASGMEMMETIRMTGAETGFFERWSGIHAEVNAAEARYRKTNGYLGLIPDLVDRLSSAGILFTGAALINNGQMGIGAFMAFQGFVTLFLQPSHLLIQVLQNLQEMRTGIERIDDVMRYPADLRDEALDTGESYDKLKGRIELRNVTFGYSPLSPPLIRDFSLTIEAGQKVALVGRSGSGKSTLANLISGLYTPWSGEILFDGIPIERIPRAVFTSSIAVVDQETALFEASIADNITMWDDTIEDYEMILAARDAQVHSEILQRDGGYDHPVAALGRNLSGGECQRIEIARVLAKDPHIVILNEATSALDSLAEHRIVEAIKERGVTTILIAHRLSTIRDSDQIVVLEQGAILEQGTHEQLLQQKGLYVNLVVGE